MATYVCTDTWTDRQTDKHTHNTHIHIHNTHTYILANKGRGHNARKWMSCPLQTDCPCGTYLAHPLYKHLFIKVQVPAITCHCGRGYTGIEDYKVSGYIPTYQPDPSSSSTSLPLRSSISAVALSARTLLPTLAALSFALNAESTSTVCC